MFDQIEKLKQNLTDQYVVVHPGVPELMRFEGHVGQVKTVNMSGRALVQFDAWNNIGWYDIEVDFLKVVPKPAAATEEKKHEAAPKPAAKPAAAAGQAKLSPLEMARMQGAAKGATAAPAGEKTAAKPTAHGGAKKSTADILAAARAAKAGAVPAAKPKLSTEDILAAARAKLATSAPAPESKPAPPPAAAPSAAAVAQPKPAAPKPAAAKPAAAPGQRPSISEILAWCREHDSK